MHEKCSEKVENTARVRDTVLELKKLPWIQNTEGY